MEQKKALHNFGPNVNDAKKIYIKMFCVKIKIAQFFIKEQKLKMILRKQKK